MKKTHLIFLCALLFSMTACHSDEMKGYEMAPQADLLKAGQPTAAAEAIPPSPEIRNLKLIKEGHITFQTDDGWSTYERVRGWVNQHQGYIAGENQFSNAYRQEHQLTIKIPNHKFEDLMQILGIGVKAFDVRKVTVKDVGEAYTDLSVRLKNMEAKADRYRKLYQRANKIGEILEVDRNLNEVVLEIDRLKGKLRYLDSQVSFSTIHLTFYQEIASSKPIEKTPGFGEKAVESLSTGWHAVQSIFLFFLTFWPVAFFIGISWGLWRFVIRQHVRGRKV